MSDTHRAHDRYITNAVQHHGWRGIELDYQLIDTETDEILNEGLSRESAIHAAARLNAQLATKEEN